MLWNLIPITNLVGFLATWKHDSDDLDWKILQGLELFQIGSFVAMTALQYVGGPQTLKKVGFPWMILTTVIEAVSIYFWYQGKLDDGIMD